MSNTFFFRHVYREYNQQADALVHLAHRYQRFGGFCNEIMPSDEVFYNKRDTVILQGF